MWDANPGALERGANDPSTHQALYNACRDQRQVRILCLPIQRYGADQRNSAAGLSARSDASKEGNVTNNENRDCWCRGLRLLAGWYVFLQKQMHFSESTEAGAVFKAAYRGSDLGLMVR